MRMCAFALVRVCVPHPLSKLEHDRRDCRFQASDFFSSSLRSFLSPVVLLLLFVKTIEKQQPIEYNGQFKLKSVFEMCICLCMI